MIKWSDRLTINGSQDDVVVVVVVVDVVRRGDSERTEARRRVQDTDTIATRAVEAVGKPPGM